MRVVDWFLWLLNMDRRLPEGVRYKSQYCDGMDFGGWWYTHTIEDSDTLVTYKGHEKLFCWRWKDGKDHGYQAFWSLRHFGASSKEEYYAELDFRAGQIRDWVKKIDATPKPSEEDLHYHNGRYYADADVAQERKKAGFS